jgi:hypothetical protein
MASGVNLITVSTAELEAAVKKLRKARREVILKMAEKELDKYGRTLRDQVRNEAPVKTGALRSSIKYTIANRGTASMELMVNAGNKQRPEVVVKTVLFGSRAHPIRPKRPGGVLRFMGRDGRIQFRKSVRHPGTKPNNFLERAWNFTSNARYAMIAKIGKLIVAEIQK